MKKVIVVTGASQRFPVRLRHEHSLKRTRCVRKHARTSGRIKAQVQEAAKFAPTQADCARSNLDVLSDNVSECRGQEDHR